MRTSDCDILIVPGLGGSGPDHWQSRWERQLSTARRVHQRDWDAPDLDAWAERVGQEALGATRPVVIVAHGLGAHVVARAASALAGRVVGAFLVAPPDLDDAARMPESVAGLRVPTAKLPFASVLIASRTDPWCAYARAAEIAEAWGAPLVDAGEAGHLDTEAGYGPWPEGLMRFAGFLKRL
ncbi:alpha/beta hydrolase [Salinarimonas sp.]|uniref:RBBP9/YdeN family alpha/beta hydrolase n=1 Tax=Salinarimonas sp. TaxID=2766526 RepID=UPI0032D96FD1